MKVQLICKADAISKRASTISQAFLKKTISKNLDTARLCMQKSSKLNSLKYDDFFNDIHYTEIDDNEYYGGKTSKSRKQEAEDVVLGMSLVNGFSGAATAQLGMADWPVYLSTFTLMLTKISTLYDIKLSTATVDSLSNAGRNTFVSLLASKAVTWIPVIGNITSGVLVGVITKTIGSKLIDKFEIAEARYRERLEMREKYNQILSDNAELKRRNEEINEILKELSDEESKKKK